MRDLGAFTTPRLVILFRIAELPQADAENWVMPDHLQSGFPHQGANRDRQVILMVRRNQALDGRVGEDHHHNRQQNN